MNKHVVYVTDKSFILYTAVSILSLLRTNDEKGLFLHIVYDRSVGEKELEIFDKLQNDFPDVELCFHIVEEKEFSDYFLKNGLQSNATMYRLILPNLLGEVEKCLLIDADTIIESNIDELFSLDMGKSVIAGVLDIGLATMDYHLEEIPSMDCYVNAGVLIMDLQRMREEKMVDCFFNMIPNGYHFHDQDILNICCYGRIKLLSDKYNYFSHRDDGTEPPVIRHLLGWEGTRPSINKRSRLSKEWWGLAKYYSEFESYHLMSKNADEWYKYGSLKYILNYCLDYSQVYIWGSKEAARRLSHGLIYNGRKVNAFVDNNADCWDKNAMIPVISAKEMMVDNDTLVINTAWKARETIKIQAMELGLSENQIINYKRRPAGFYTVLANEYRQEELEELYLWEYGTVRVE